MKRKFTIFFALCMLVLATLVAGCGTSSEGDKFIGTWEGPSIKNDSFSGDLYYYITIDKKTDTQFELTEYTIKDGSTSLGKTGLSSRKEVEMLTLDKKDPKVLVRSDGEKLILKDDKTLTNTYRHVGKPVDYKKTSDKVLPFKEFSPVKDAPEPK